MCDIGQLVNPSNTENETLYFWCPSHHLNGCLYNVELLHRGNKKRQKESTVNSRCHAFQNILIS